MSTENEVAIEPYKFVRESGQVWIVPPDAAEAEPLGPFSSDETARHWLEENRVQLDLAVAAMTELNEADEAEGVEEEDTDGEA